MLIQFSVENFKSFKNETILSMAANSSKDHEDNLIVYNAKRFIPTAAIYGANASGKTSLHQAITAAVLIIRGSNDRQIDSPEPNIRPFKLDDTSRNKPTRFDFIFTSNNKKYQYGFTADQNVIYDEYLYEFLTARPSIVFKRENTEKYKFGKQYSKELSDCVEKNTSNKLFLATATSWNCECTKDAYLWLANSVETTNFLNRNRSSSSLLKNFERYSSNPRFHEFLLKLTKEADINISDYNAIVHKFSQDTLQELDINNPKVAEPNWHGFEKIEVLTQHEVNTDGLINDYMLSLSDESEGTRALFFESPFLFDALTKGKTVSIDELDNSLHPYLTKMIVNMFNSPEMNKNGAQLIFNTHDISLLTLELFRRDQIYFTEKDNRTGISQLYSLDEYSPRNKENIQKGYMQGRYGAVPNVGEGEFEW